MTHVKTQFFWIEINMNLCKMLNLLFRGNKTVSQTRMTYPDLQGMCLQFHSDNPQHFSMHF